MIDLKPEHREIVLEILRRRVPECDVWVFGSRAAGKAKPHSDLDLAILGETPLGTMRIADIEEDFSESDLPFRVDVVDMNAVGEPFREIIRQRHEVLLKVEKQA